MVNKYKNLVKKVVQRYINRPGLLGIIWIGSSTFGIDDKNVDIDIRLITDKKEKYIPMEKFDEENISFEVDEISLDWILQEETNLNSEQSWMRKKGIILYDPNNFIKIEFEKINTIESDNREQLMWSVYTEIYNIYDIKKCLNRGEILAAYMFFNKTIDMLTKFIFLVNDYPIPSFKWRYFFIKKYNLFDINEIENLVPTNLNKLEQQINYLEKMQSKIQALLIKKGYDKKRVMEPWKF